MLSSISWSQFITGTLVITAVYYLYILRRWYHQEFCLLLNKTANHNQSFPGVESHPSPVIGAIHTDAGPALSGGEDIRFTQTSPDEMIPDHDTVFTGDAKKLVDSFRESHDKKEFVRLLGVLVKSAKNLDEAQCSPEAIKLIFDYAAGRLPFAVTPSDLQGV